jgi:membrane protease YdiL (CAAX protease family)
MYFFETADIRTLFVTRSSYSIELLVGLLYGLVTSFFAWRLIAHPYMAEIKTHYGGMIASIKMKPADIVFVSFCAGFGEEILFRGAIQPAWGVWITSVVFVALHGYLNPINLKVSIYGLYLLLVIAGIGYMNDYFGLTACDVAHTVIDVYLFTKLSYRGKHDKAEDFERI